MNDLTELPLLLEPEQLTDLLGNPELLIVDVCSPDSYARHHIPGAVHLAPGDLQSGMQPAPGSLPSVEKLTLMFSRIGLGSDRHVVAYDAEGGGWAGRLLWTLDVLGHTRYSYLNGGLVAWANEGHPLSDEPEKPAPSSFTATIHPEPIAELDYVVDSLERDDAAIWDARSAEEYTGARVAAARAGHIPGAVNIDWVQLMDPQRNLRLRDLEQIRQQLQQAGLTPDKEIITHCQTHHRSGLAYLAMKLLGYPRIKGYDGSWAEWGNRADTPITTGPTP